MDKQEHAIKEGIKVTLPCVVYTVRGSINDRQIPEPNYHGQCLLLEKVRTHDKSTFEEAANDLVALTKKHMEEFDILVDHFEGFGYGREDKATLGTMLKHIFLGQVRQVVYKKIEHSEFNHLKYDLELQILEVDYRPC